MLDPVNNDSNLDVSALPLANDGHGSYSTAGNEYFLIAVANAGPKLWDLAKAVFAEAAENTAVLQETFSQNSAAVQQTDYEQMPEDPSGNFVGTKVVYYSTGGSVTTTTDANGNESTSINGDITGTVTETTYAAADGRKWTVNSISPMGDACAIRGCGSHVRSTLYRSRFLR